MHRYSSKRLEKDNIRPPVPSKRPRTNTDALLLFGDTEDIDDDDEILEISRLPSSSKRINTASKNKPLESPFIPPVVKYRRVLKHVPNVPYVPLTVSNGDRLYLRLLPDHNSISLETKESDPRKTKIQPRTYKGILGVNFNNLKREALLLSTSSSNNVGKNGIPKPESFHKDNETMELELEELDSELWGVQSEVSSNASGIRELKNANGVKKKKTETTLWVEKYRPRGYMDLLSEESVNQDLLHWLKLWDNCVFGRDYLARHKEIKEKFSKLEEKEREKQHWKKNLIQDDAYDELGRPQQKIVLLHGPAGLGKTTAAHIVAKVGGYNIVEINASDDRSVDIFRKILDSTTESRSEMFQDGRPNCLIVDEIDGSPAATVDVLVDLVCGKAKETGKNKRKKVLRRPIICICNELYIPSLKNLRQVALLLQFHPIPVSSLVARIEEISLKEDMILDNGTLHSIAEKSECDIRACLSTLQFIKQKNGKLNHSILNQLGSKDKCKGIFGVWEDIFFLPDGKRYYNNSDPTRGDARFTNVLTVVQNFGDYEKLQGGVYENYLKTRFRDSYFETILKSLKWNAWFMELQGRINMLQNYSMLAYLPMYFVGIHFLCGGRRTFNVQYPSNTMQAQSSRFTNFKTQLNEMPASIGRFLDLSSAILDVFPLMLTVIQPSTIRPIPSQLWSQAEKECVRNIVEIMLGYHLSYRQHRSPEGNYLFQLDPDIEELTSFPREEASTTHQKFPYTLKQIISREIDIEKMRQEEPREGIKETSGNEEGAKHSESQPKQPEASTSTSTTSSGPPPPEVPNWKQRLHKYDRDKTVKPSTVAKDFFGRPVVPKPVTPEQAKVLAKKASASGIWYQYKEGYSNSVRKKLKVKDFL